MIVLSVNIKSFDSNKIWCLGALPYIATVIDNGCPVNVVDPSKFSVVRLSVV